MTQEELRELLAASNGDKYIFDQNTTFIKEQTITVQPGGHFHNGSQPKQKEERQGANNELILKLMPICMDNEEYAKEFLDAIMGKDGLVITNAVKSFREQKKVDAMLCHHNLWQILYDNNIYKLTERNWNARIGY